MFSPRQCISSDYCDHQFAVQYFFYRVVLYGSTCPQIRRRSRFSRSLVNWIVVSSVRIFRIIEIDEGKSHCDGVSLTRHLIYRSSRGGQESDRIFGYPKTPIK